jgi:hypothetical protein
MTYHVCYLVDCDESNCTSINIEASSYQDALKKFQKDHSNQIVYICDQQKIHECLKYMTSRSTTADTPR